MVKQYLDLDGLEYYHSKVLGFLKEKIDDVKVNGVSVVNEGVANIPVPNDILNISFKTSNIELNKNSTEFYPNTKAVSDYVSKKLNDYSDKNLNNITTSGEQKIRNVVSSLINTIQGPTGETGMSAYDIAVLQGFKGNIEDWLESLKGGMTKEERELLNLSVKRVNLDKTHTLHLDNPFLLLLGETYASECRIMSFSNNFIRFDKFIFANQELSLNKELYSIIVFDDYDDKSHRVGHLKGFIDITNHKLFDESGNTEINMILNKDYNEFSKIISTVFYNNKEIVTVDEINDIYNKIDTIEKCIDRVVLDKILDEILDIETETDAEIILNEILS